MAIQKSISLLAERYAVTFLLFLFDKNKVMSSEAKSISGNYYTTAELARKMETAGLIEIQTVQKPYLTNYYSITEKGKKVAEKLLEAEQIIGTS
ncbi:MAG TPA: hypothetical protein VGK23_07345 [Methanomassiliicoccales archaeon]|jgi:DNA-binding HxlR family transcriptional regulator